MVNYGNHSYALISSKKNNNNSSINNNNEYGIILLHIDNIAVWIQIISIVFSVVGNCLVIFGTYNLRRLTLNKMVINYLAICDLTYSFIQTLYVHRKLSNHAWHFGKLLCSLTVLSPCAISSSFFIITFIAYERHRSIMYPLQLRFKRFKITIFMITILLFSLVLQSPYLLHMKVYREKEDHFDCGCIWDAEVRKYWDLVVFVLTYPLPISMFLYCYVRIIMRVARRFNGTTENLTMQKSVYTQNKKLCVTLAAIVAVFVITTSPNQILLMWKDFGDKHHEDAFQTFVILYSLSTLVHLHSFSNPIIYSLSDSKFRQVLFQGAQMTSLRKTIILSLRRSNKKHQTRDCSNPQLEHNDSNEFHLEEPAHQRMIVHHTERGDILVSTTKFQETYL